MDARVARCDRKCRLRRPGEAQRLHAIKESLSRLELIKMPRRGTAVALADIAGIVRQVAEARVGLQLRPIREVDGARRDVIDSRKLVVTGGQ
jgi:hypothetical protein